MKNTKKVGIILILFLVTTHVGYSQYANTKVKSKFESYTDSLKKVKYNYTFPIFGQKAYEKGFDIPYPAGGMANYVWMKQDILITNLQLGFSSENEDIPLTPVDFIDFGNNTNVSHMINVRPDLWVFPFLNVYGLFGRGNSTTEVNIISPLNFTSKVEQELTTLGFGVMGAAGVGPVFLTVDANWTWSKPKLLNEPVKVSVLGIRFGHSFVFKNKPQSNIAVWVGTMRASLSSQTSGAIALNEALPQSFWDDKDAKVADYWSWYNDLNPNNPLDAKKIEVADEILTPIVNSIDNANGDGIVSYSMDKQVKEMWNGLVGAQYQLNKRWQLRTEAGVVGNRKSFLVSLNYRFLM
jgi:hypothetical protein